jgi:RNA polymerase sigma factor (sigma-70 family)
MNPQFDDVLARLIASGAAREDLVVLCLERLRAIARRMLDSHPELRRQEDTDDLIQNAAIRLHRAFAAVAVESPQHAMALAVTQLKRELVDLIRRHRCGRVEGIPGAIAGQTVQDDPTLQAWEEFHRIVDSLPAEQRQAVHFLWYLGMTQPEAAKLLGVTDRTLRRRWSEARSALRARLDELDFGTG